MKESKQPVRKVSEYFDTTAEYSVDVSMCTEEEIKKVQQAFFDVGISWIVGGKVYKYLDAKQYSNTAENGTVSSYLVYSSMINGCNMTAEQFLKLVYEPNEQKHVQTELKNKKLIDLLIDNNIQWPDDASGVVQDGDCFIKFYTGEKPVIHDIGVWLIDDSVSDLVYFDEIASDYKTAIITKTDWEHHKVNKKPMFADIKVGDKVWDIRQGWGVVCGLTQRIDYPIDVEFGEEYNSYTRGGFCHLDDINPTLFWDEIKIEVPPKPLPDLSVDTKVIVWNKTTPKTKRYFSHFNASGKIMCFANGMTSWLMEQTTEWDDWELAE